MREIVLDTETTGLDPIRGDRLVEIGCVELVNRIATGREYHVYMNPERDMPPQAEAVHGLSAAFLADKPLFSTLALEFLAFIGTDPLIIHNASFDIGFLNAELARLKQPALSMSRVVDTLALARRKHPAGPNSLDALCKRYGVDGSQRTKHGALIDASLLASVYVELAGGRQAELGLAGGPAGLRADGAGRQTGLGSRAAQVRPLALPQRITETERLAHAALITSFGAGAVWLDYA